MKLKLVVRGMEYADAVQKERHQLSTWFSAKEKSRPL